MLAPRFCCMLYLLFSARVEAMLTRVLRATLLMPSNL